MKKSTTMARLVKVAEAQGHKGREARRVAARVAKSLAARGWRVAR